ncbi:hypothetical protein [[Enterobacter] lignolyticus]|uniref:Uncharacterized protein n=1 Tax=[Enterobacter] lignolyticus TaxID=1334193 RepID=A0A806XA53_9ENTR|nr:hypothetical protein [[Enterobacter] lignolyticus]ALR76513.1 hypothetical protein AO703_09450 [[Enterobacter] lignolyticus]
MASNPFSHGCVLLFILIRYNLSVLGNTFVTLSGVSSGGWTNQSDEPSVFPGAEARKMALEKMGVIDGGNQTLARLAGYVIKT